MKNRLVILTSSFPYEKSETFLINEIPILEEHFYEIVVVPTKKASDKKLELFNHLRTELPTFSSSWFNLLFVFYKKYFLQELLRIGFNIAKLKVFVKYIIFSRSLYKSCEKFILENESTVFYSYWADESAVALSMLKKKYGSRVKCVTRCHGWDLYFERHPKKYLPLRSFVLSYLDGVFPISDMGANYINTRWSSKKNKNIKTFRLGVKGISKSPDDKINRKLIVSCSNIIPLKRIELIVEALSLLEDKEVRWVHFGDGLEMDKIKRLAEEKLSGIQWELKGRIPNKEILQFYKESNPCLFINASSTEGIPVSIMEAMSSGIPCLATDVGGTFELVNSSNGKLLPPDLDATILSGEIKLILNMDNSQFKRLSNAAKQQWKENYSSEKNYNEFADELLKLSC